MIKNTEQRLGDIWTTGRLFEITYFIYFTGLNIHDKAYTWSRDDSGIIAGGKIDAEEIFVGDVYFDQSLKARVKILNKSEKDAITFKGTYSKS